MSIDGCTAAAPMQVHPVSARLLPFGNKFYPQSGRVSALFFVHTVFVQSLMQRRCILPGFEMQKRESCCFSCSYLSSRTAPPHGTKRHWRRILGDCCSGRENVQLESALGEFLFLYSSFFFLATVTTFDCHKWGARQLQETPGDRENADIL